MDGLVTKFSDYFHQVLATDLTESNMNYINGIYFRGRQEVEPREQNGHGGLWSISS